MVKCFSPEDVFNHLPMSVKLPERPVILSFAVKLPYTKYSMVNVANQAPVVRKADSAVH